MLTSDELKLSEVLYGILDSTYKDAPDRACKLLVAMAVTYAEQAVDGDAEATKLLAMGTVVKYVRHACDMEVPDEQSKEPS